MTEEDSLPVTDTVSREGFFFFHDFGFFLLLTSWHVRLGMWDFVSTSWCNLFGPVAQWLMPCSSGFLSLMYAGRKPNSLLLE